LRRMSDLGLQDGTVEPVGGPEDPDSPYDLGLQIVGLFAIIVASFIGIVLSFVFEWAGKRVNATTKASMDIFMVLMRGAGTGVLISTALIHLIGEAYEYFEDAGWDEGYEQWPMVFAMVGIFVMALLEFANLRIGARSCPALDESAVLAAAEKGEAAKAAEKQADMPAENKSKGFTKHQRNALLVEGTILAHSVLIGFDLGLQNKAGWLPLITAICFHQFFEGFALGQVVMEAKFDTLKNCLMVFFYSITTAVGVAIGIGLYMGHNYDGKSVAADITIGILNALCGGILLFMGLSLFLIEWFVANKEYHMSDSLLLPSLGFVGIAIGLVIMAVIGKWA